MSLPLHVCVDLSACPCFLSLCVIVILCFSTGTAWVLPPKQAKQRDAAKEEMVGQLVRLIQLQRSIHTPHPLIYTSTSKITSAITWIRHGCVVGPLSLSCRACCLWPCPHSLGACRRRTDCTILTAGRSATAFARVPVFRCPGRLLVTINIQRAHDPACTRAGKPFSASLPRTLWISH